MIIHVADFAFKAAQKAFAGEVQFDAAFLAGLHDEVHDFRELFVVQLEFGVLPGPSHREDGKDPPGAGTERDEVFLEFFEAGEVALVDTGDYVEDEILLLRHHPDGVRGVLEGFWMAAHPGMVFLEAVEADGGGMDAAGEQAVEAPAVEQDAVGHHAPGVLTAVEFFSYVLEVASHQWFASRENNEGGVRIDMRSQAVDYAQEVGSGHVFDLGADAAVTATMQTRRVAAQRAFPKKLTEPVLFNPLVLEFREEFEFQPLARPDMLAHYFFFILKVATLTLASPEFHGFLSFLFFSNLMSTRVLPLSNSPPLAGPSVSSNWTRICG